ncbi:2-hydroxychromene-2-carboxylate isomerase [Skermanella mucosa]|uniref:2-hydroxychromene-2-carboxylate isomerase n=1 Tax=Skermanella mucosa TaxID=1789672 RepID=UPI00192BA22E|nr:2-hydroxychromene-2-carboxylate isomerase [Skermanella mucosa]UEM21430.1 2-hydroxychromene-2-carboxylate isomerase [Skermanella mucosa]
MTAPIDFYFDFASPYGYLAATQIDGIAERHGRAVRWCPILLGAVFKVSGMKPVMEQPLRGDYLSHDAPRFARLLGVPLTMPAKVPLNGLAASRAYWWLEGRDPAKARDLAKAVYHAHWGEGRDMTTAEQVAEAAEPLGIAAADLAAGVQDPVVKDRLRAETDEAIRRGVFGAPFFIVDGEAFWGADRLHHVEQWLARGGW